MDECFTKVVRTIPYWTSHNNSKLTDFLTLGFISFSRWRGRQWWPLLLWLWLWLMWPWIVNKFIKYPFQTICSISSLSFGKFSFEWIVSSQNLHYRDLSKEEFFQFLRPIYKWLVDLHKNIVSYFPMKGITLENPSRIDECSIHGLSIISLV